MNYRQAKQKAIEWSKARPNHNYYVNWVEDKEWEVDDMPEFPEEREDHARNGNWILAYHQED